MIKYQENYETRTKIYTNDTINEWNLGVKKYKTLLFCLGLGACIAFTFISVVAIPIFTSKKKPSCGCCNICEGISPIKMVLVFYIVYSPCIVLTIYCFYLTIIKKISYNELLTNENITYYKNFESKGKKIFFRIIYYK